ADPGQIGGCSHKRLTVHHRQAEAVLMPVGTADALVGIEIDVAISADHTAQVADLVVRRSHRRNGKRGSEAHQLIAGCQMGTPFAPCAGAGYILPSSIREEPVIAARNEKGPVTERNLEGRLLSLPMRQDTRL